MLIAFVPLFVFLPADPLHLSDTQRPALSAVVHEREIQEWERQPYSASILEQKLNVPGIDCVTMLFIAPANLFNPTVSPRKTTELGLGRWLERAGDYLWNLCLSDFQNNIRASLDTRGGQNMISVVSGGECWLSSDLTFQLPYCVHGRWQSRKRFEYSVPANGTTREFVERLPPDKTGQDATCIEGLLPFELTGEAECRLQIGFGPMKLVLFERLAQPFRHKGTFILRLCRTQNWYSARMQYMNRNISTGWKQAEATVWEQQFLAHVRRPGLVQDFGFTWSKRAVPFTDKDGKSTSVILVP
jgi:hypothetical protein